MSNDKASRSDSTSSNGSPTLSDRVKGRVSEARLALDQGTGRAKRPRARPASPLKAGMDDDRDTLSLQQVYGELRVAYRRYRLETGKPSVPALRDAVHAFRQGPSLTSLVSVASFLDDRGLLAW